MEFNSDLIRQYMTGTDVLKYGIDYYLCEDEKRTEEEATELAYAFALKYCRKWYRRDRKDPETRHRRAYDSFAQRVQDKQYFYSERRRKLDQDAAQAKNDAAHQAEQEKLWENERKRVTALRERCIAQGLDFERENKKQLKRKYLLQRICIGIETCCLGLFAFSFYSCCASLDDWKNIGLNLLFTIALFAVSILTYVIFCRPSKRLPDEAYAPIGKNKKKAR